MYTVPTDSYMVTKHYDNVIDKTPWKVLVKPSNRKDCIYYVEDEYILKGGVSAQSRNCFY